MGIESKTVKTRARTGFPHAGRDTVFPSVPARQHQENPIRAGARPASERSALDQGLSDGAGVGVLDFAAHGQAAGDA